MKNYFTESGELIVSALLVMAGTGFLLSSLSSGGGIWLLVRAFETAVCGG